MPQAVSIACEGFLDRVVLERLLAAHQIEVGSVYDMGGKRRLDDKLPGYVNAARFGPWIVQRDLDNDAACAPDLVRRLVHNPPLDLCLIVALRQVDAWLLADRKAIAAHLRVAKTLVPEDPEALPDAKMALVNLARRSRAREVRRDMIPTVGSGRRIGGGYTARMQAFVQQDWDFRQAARVAPSLARLVARMQRFHRIGAWHA